MRGFSSERSDDVTALSQRVRDSFMGRSILRFVLMEGFDRSIILSAQVFTALIPLFIIVASVAPAGQEDVIGEGIIKRFALTGASADDLETAAAQGDPEPVVSAAHRLLDQGARAVLATLGAAGAVLVDETGSWMATPPPIVPRSTVGAGDASLAGYVRADVGGAEPPQRLQMAVAYGSAAAALPGSALPTPAQIDLNAVRVTPIAPISPTTNTKVSS